MSDLKSLTRLRSFVFFFINSVFYNVLNISIFTIFLVSTVIIGCWFYVRQLASKEGSQIFTILYTQERGLCHLEKNSSCLCAKSGSQGNTNREGRGG